MKVISPFNILFAGLAIVAFSGCPSARPHSGAGDGSVQDAPGADSAGGRAGTGGLGGAGGGGGAIGSGGVGTGGTGTGGMSTGGTAAGGAGGTAGGGGSMTVGTGGLIGSGGIGVGGGGDGGSPAAGTGGAGGGVCSPPCGTGKACTMGICCNIDETNCDGSCVDLVTDGRNCGMCGKRCNANEQCSATLCKLVDGQPCTLGSNCLSGICTTFYRDADGDTWGTSQTVGRCTVTEAPAGYATRMGDCCDVAPDEPTRVISAKIHPGAGFQVDSAGGVCGITWDYDCDGHVESNIQKVVGCVSDSPPCLDRMGDVDPSFCGMTYYECAVCGPAATGPADPPACAYYPLGDATSGCIDGAGQVWECK